MNNLKIPKHIAIIMDGSGRWAKSQGKQRTFGHQEGGNALLRVIDACIELKVKALSAYAFSTENFKRPASEVTFLMDLFVTGIKKHVPSLIKKDVKIVFSGRDEGLSKKVIGMKQSVEAETKDNKGLVLNICLNYGSQYEILDAVNSLIATGKENVTLEDLNRALYQDLPPVDLLIRSSGELRLSNFMLYQIAYAELYFTDTFWPDFEKNELQRAIDAYNLRDRRFGGLNENKSD